MTKDWTTDIHYLGGSPDKEKAIIDRLVADVHREVGEIARKSGRPPQRPQHTKMIGGITNAIFRVAAGLPDEFRYGFLIPGAEYPAVVRLSNAAAYPVKEDMNDLHGAAIAVYPNVGDTHHWLMTNAEVHHARNAVEALATSIAFCFPGKFNKLKGTLRLIRQLGLGNTLRIVRTLKAQTAIPVESMATETFFSRAPIRIGNTAVKYRLYPTATKRTPQQSEPDLSMELRTRLLRGEVSYSLQVQRYVSPAATPIEDATVLWKSPFETIATLILPSQQLADKTAFFENHHFNPWQVNTPDFEPLGNMNRARRMVYASAVTAQKH